MAIAPTGIRPTHRPSRKVVASSHFAIGTLSIALLGGCSGSTAGDTAEPPPKWSVNGLNALSKPITWAGVTAVTALTKAGRLETVALDVTDGRRLWATPATMAGRLPGMGVQPPAVATAAGQPIVVALEPRKPGKWAATLVARDARTGARRWTRPVDSTLGPIRCGPNVCMSEFTARPNARFVSLDPTTGRSRWRLPGVAEVEWADNDRVVVFRLVRRPTVTAYALGSGKALWDFPVDKAVGRGVNVGGGWSFGSLSPNASGALVGYVGPARTGKNRPLSAFGLFALRLSDGKPLWARQRLLRIYPNANPAVALLTREVDGAGRYQGFAQLDPRTGGTVARLPLTAAPATNWWLALPRDLSTLGFLTRNAHGSAYALPSGRRITPRAPSWSFCAPNVAPLRIKDHKGFYPIPALCPFDLATGRQRGSAEPPPRWYTGSVDGWRVWRDDRGRLQGSRDTHGTLPGMYGP